MRREKSRISPKISQISPVISDQVRREKSRWEKTIGGVVFTGRQEVMARAKAIIEEGKAATPEGAISYPNPNSQP